MSLAYHNFNMCCCQWRAESDSRMAQLVYTLYLLMIRFGVRDRIYMHKHMNVNINYGERAVRHTTHNDRVGQQTNKQTHVAFAICCRHTHEIIKKNKKLYGSIFSLSIANYIHYMS